MPSFSTQLQLKQQQRLVMTPMLLQALKILQMNSLELKDLVQEELSENPILEEAAEAGVSDPEILPASMDPALPGNDEEAAPALQEPAETTPSTEENWEEYFDESGADFRGSQEKGGTPAQSLENFVAAGPSLQEHLLSQLAVEDVDAPSRSLAETLIGHIDERGYLEDSLEAIAASIGTDAAALFTVLRLLQRFDPPGVGARDLRECLLIQLEALQLKGGLAWRLVADHLQDLGRRREAELLKATQASLPELRQAEAVIASLEPMPGRPFGGKANPAVQVDAFVEKGADGAWHVHVNDSHLPRLGFNAYYRRLMKTPGSEGEDAQRWLKEKYDRALWLIRGIAQRKKTLRRVLEEIVEVQSGFLEQGAAAFQPLTLKDIALKTGLHESTVSRVTSGKYVQTPRGVFELKYFFSSGLKTDGDTDTSSMAVKQVIRELLEEEDPLHPLSDAQIAKAMEAKGVRVARRTVAKYREELKLPPAHLRKEGR